MSVPRSGSRGRCYLWLGLVLLAMISMTSREAQAGKLAMIPPGQEQQIRAVVVDAIAAAREAGELPLELDERLDIHIDRDHFRVTLHPAAGVRVGQLPRLAVFHPEAFDPTDLLSSATALAPGISLRCVEEGGQPRACSKEESTPWRGLAQRVDARRATLIDQIWRVEQSQTPATAVPEPEHDNPDQRAQFDFDRAMTLAAMLVGLALLVFAGVRGRGRSGAPRWPELLILTALLAVFVGASASFTPMLPLHEHNSFVARSDCALVPTCLDDPVGAWNLSSLNSYGLVLAWVPYTARGLAQLSLAVNTLVLVLLWALARVLIRRFGHPELSALAGLSAVAVLASHPVAWRLAGAGTFWPWALMWLLSAALAGLWASEADTSDSWPSRIAKAMAWQLAAVSLAMACGGNFVLLTLGSCAALGPLCWTSAWERPRPWLHALAVALPALGLATMIGLANYRAGLERIASESLGDGLSLVAVIARANPLLLDTRINTPIWGLASIAALAWLWPRRESSEGPRRLRALRLSLPLLYAWLVPGVFLAAAASEIIDSGYPVGFINHHWELTFTALWAGLGVAWIVHRLAAWRSFAGWPLLVPGVCLSLALMLNPRAEQGWAMATRSRVLERELVALEAAFAELPAHNLLIIPPRLLDPTTEAQSEWDPIEVNFPVGFYAAAMRVRGLEPARILYLDRLELDRPGASLPPEFDVLIYVGSSLRSFQPHEIAAGAVSDSLERPDLERLRNHYALEPVHEFVIQAEQHEAISLRLGADRVPEIELGFYRLRAHD